MRSVSAMLRILNCIRYSGKNKVYIGHLRHRRFQMDNKTNKRAAQEALTYSIPVAGGMAGLAKNASYAAARRGKIPSWHSVASSASRG